MRFLQPLRAGEECAERSLAAGSGHSSGRANLAVAMPASRHRRGENKTKQILHYKEQKKKKKK